MYVHRTQQIANPVERRIFTRVSRDRYSRYRRTATGHGARPATTSAKRFPVGRCRCGAGGLATVLKAFWRDERGSVVSAEAVVVGTGAVVGATVGMGTAAESVNGEMHELAYSFRSLDQSYGLHGFNGATSWTPGSYFRQQDVAVSRAQLDAYAEQVRQRYLRHDAEAMREDEGQARPVEAPRPDARPIEEGRG